MGLSNIFRTFIPKKVLVYSAIGQKDYYRTTDKLSTHMIKYWSKAQLSADERHNYFRSKNTIYDIYVKEEDIQKANEVIHDRN